MKKILIITLVLPFVGCEMRTENEKLGSLKSPIVVVAIDKIGNESKISGDVVLKDVEGKIISFDCMDNISRAVSNSRKVGDTLK